MAETRRCVGSTRFGIEPHDAPVGEFSAQPSQKDGLSRMCTTHWREYVAGLARESKERKAAAVAGEADRSPVITAEPTSKARRSCHGTCHRHDAVIVSSHNGLEEGERAQGAGERFELAVADPPGVGWVGPGNFDRDLDDGEGGEAVVTERTPEPTQSVGSRARSA